MKTEVAIGKNKQSYMNLAKKIAILSEFPTYKMGCVIVKGGRVISCATNKESPGVLKDSRYKNKSFHCELRAILFSKVDLRGASIFIAGFTRCGNNILSKPCHLCEVVIKEAGIKNIYYHNKEGVIKKLVDNAV